MKPRILLPLAWLLVAGLLLFGCNNPDAVSRVLGSFGSIGGALAASLLIGLVEALSGFYLAPVVKYVAVFGLYLAVVLFRPKGLFGW